MARIGEIERRLENWSRWKQGGGLGGLGYASVQLNGESERARFREAVIPTVDCEAEETDRAVAGLESTLRRTVEVFYLEPEGYEAKARYLCIGVAGMYRRLERAHALLHNWFVELQAKRRAERARVEATHK